MAAGGEAPEREPLEADAAGKETEGTAGAGTTGGEAEGLVAGVVGAAGRGEGRGARGGTGAGAGFVPEAASGGALSGAGGKLPASLSPQGDPAQEESRSASGKQLRHRIHHPPGQRLRWKGIGRRRRPPGWEPALIRCQLAG